VDGTGPRHDLLSILDGDQREVTTRPTEIHVGLEISIPLNAPPKSCIQSCAQYITLIMHQFLADWRNLLWLVGLAGGAILVALVSHAIIYAIGKRIANRREGKFYQLLVTRQERPTRLLLPLLALMGIIPWLPLSQVILSRLNHLVVLLLIASIAWLLVAMLDMLQDYIEHRQTLALSDSLTARRIRTQVQVLRHIAVVVIVVITVAIMVMTFPSARHVGESGEARFDDQAAG